jgi:hypothetical protein
MSQSQHINVNFKNTNGAVNATIILIDFKEGANYIVYSPHLEVTGYGITPQDAVESFNISLRAFFEYTLNKKTLHKVLTSIGWVLKKGSEKKALKITAPSISELIKHNTLLEEILNKQNITTTQKQVAIPV